MERRALSRLSRASLVATATAPADVSDADADADLDDGAWKRREPSPTGVMDSERAIMAKNHARKKMTPQLREALESEARVASGDLVEALAHAEECVKLAPYWYRGHACAAVVYLARGENARARESLERAMFLEPSMRRDAAFRVLYDQLA